MIVISTGAVQHVDQERREAERRAAEERHRHRCAGARPGGRPAWLVEGTHRADLLGLQSSVRKQIPSPRTWAQLAGRRSCTHPQAARGSLPALPPPPPNSALYPQPTHIHTQPTMPARPPSDPPLQAAPAPPPRLVCQNLP